MFKLFLATSRTIYPTFLLAEVSYLSSNYKGMYYLALKVTNFIVAADSDVKINGITIILCVYITLKCVEFLIQ